MHTRGQRSYSPTPSDDSIQNDLVAMGIIMPKPKKSVSVEEPSLAPVPVAAPVTATAAAPPRRSLKITLTGIRANSLHKGAREREEQKKRETLSTGNGKNSGSVEGEDMLTRSQATAVQVAGGKGLDASNTSRTPNRSTSSIGTPSTVSKRKRLSNGQWTSSKKPRSKAGKPADEDVIPANDDSLTSSDSDDNLGTFTQTRSGRMVHRPEVLVIEDYRRLRTKRESETPHLSSLLPTKTQLRQSSGRDTPVSDSRRRQRSTRKGHDTLQRCIRCERSNAPPGNPIIHCDKCNEGWHQFCHDPPANEGRVNNKHVRWLCSKCSPTSRSRSESHKRPSGSPHKKKIRNRAQQSGTTQYTAQNSTTEMMPTSTSLPLREVGGSQFSRDEQRGYLASLSHTALVDLLLDISTTSPELPMFPQNLRSLPSVSFLPGSTPSTVLKQAPQISGFGAKLNNKSQPTKASDDDDDDQSVYAEEHRLYPAPGNGFKLPPIEEDMHVMIEDPSCATFSHSLHGPAAASRSDTNVQKSSKLVDTAG